MRWTKKRREEFKDTLDLVLAMTDMAELPENAAQVREVFGKRNGKYDKQVSVRQFTEAEIVSCEHESLSYLSDEYEDGKIIFGCDARTDLPTKYSTSICQVKKGIANFYQLKSIPISVLRGKKLLSPWFAKYSIFSMDLETGIGAGSEDIVFWSHGVWRRQNETHKKKVRHIGAVPGEVTLCISDDSPELTNDCCKLLAGMTFSRDFHWRVVIKTPEGNSFSLMTDSKGASAAFADRSGDTPSGRRPALRNWVSEHTRKNRKTSDDGNEFLQMVAVRKHLRGRIPFKWCGLDCELVVSPFDMRQNEKLAEQRALVSAS
jgi:hypothetical protein